GHPLCNYARGAARRMVYRAFIVALDFLVFSAARAADDAVHLPGNTESAGADRSEAINKLGRFLVRQYWACTIVWRARPGRAAGLVGIGGDCRDANKRRVPDHRRNHSPVEVTEPAGECPVPWSEKHTDPGH